MKLAIVILNWNGKKFLEQFLPTLLKHTPEYAEVVVADNASTDDSISFLKECHPQVRILSNDRNYGFAEGYNLALEKVDAEYYCLLNSDIEVTEGWAESVIEMMESDPSIAAAQPKLRSLYHRESFEYAGAAGGFIDKYGYPFCRGRVFNTVEKDEGQYDTPIDIFWASGAALFVRSRVYRELGGLDADFFAHMEEIDLCWRIRNHGYRIVVQPQSVVYHVGGGTLPKNNSFKTFLNFRNNHFLLLKNLPGRRLFPTFLARIVLDNVAAFSFLAQGHVKDFTAVYKAHWAVVKQFGKIKCKRDGHTGAYAAVWKRPILLEYHLFQHKKFNGSEFIK
ncbi:MAG: glycosyltransferase family 2 protein [Bacteroidales bacterium]|nr:glycosyltransferase family 2 protein [Bacteroidales bacterium]